MDSIILIPSLQPSYRLLQLIDNYKKIDDRTIIVIDDGSGESYQHYFDMIRNYPNCFVFHFKDNKGKGAALKFGFKKIWGLFPDAIGCVTADSDGQHHPSDILRVVEALEYSPNSLILGIRDFSIGNTSFKSLWGNKLTSYFLKKAYGVACNDTQTGLRGVPSDFYKQCLSLEGDRFEFEMEMIIEASNKKINIIEVPIQTIYLENNKSSHFQPFKDSYMIYSKLLKFSVSSLLSAGCDLLFFSFCAYIIFVNSEFSLLYSTVIARIFSGGINFLINQMWVFSCKKKTLQKGSKYLILFLVQMVCSWLLISLFSNYFSSLILIKIFVYSGLFFISYWIQNNLIFPQQEEKHRSVI